MKTNTNKTNTNKMKSQEKIQLMSFDGHSVEINPTYLDVHETAYITGYPDDTKILGYTQDFYIGISKDEIYGVNKFTEINPFYMCKCDSVIFGETGQTVSEINYDILHISFVSSDSLMKKPIIGDQTTLLNLLFNKDNVYSNDRNNRQSLKS